MRRETAMVLLAGVFAAVIVACSTMGPDNRTGNPRVISNPDRPHTVCTGEEIELSLVGYPSTGYVWRLNGYDSSLIRFVRARYVAVPGIGSQWTWFFRFIPTAAGTTEVLFQNEQGGLYDTSANGVLDDTVWIPYDTADVDSFVLLISDC